MIAANVVVNVEIFQQWDFSKKKKKQWVPIYSVEVSQILEEWQ